MNKKIKITSILNNATNLTDIFSYYERHLPDASFMFKKEGNEWKGQNFKITGQNVSKIFSVLTDLGVRKGDRVFLLSSNRIEWVEFDLAIMLAGAITIPSFVTNNFDDNKYIIEDCKPKILIFENDIALKKNKEILNNFDKSKVISIEKNKNFVNYDEILKNKNKKIKKLKLQHLISQQLFIHLALVEVPKGVVLQHKALLHNLAAALELLNEFNIDMERFMSFLPLSHSYERVAGLYFPLLINAQIYFCSSIDKLFLEIKEVKPTIFSAVPRLYENIYKIKSKIKSSGKIEKNNEISVSIY